ncbi:MAG: glycoside hydrolase family 3 C-terminal domain-containing protein [Anaerolineales bacterium]|nr:glycoside hydrolase family 3 C-terminal domain-containing protein [Anaerolineales bacterium]
MRKNENHKQAIEKLIDQMTLEEKVSQLVFDSPAIERLGIPAHNWWSEALHGLGRAGVATVFPQAIGLGATWNPELLFRIATAISDEARAKHHQAVRQGYRGYYSGLTFWSPNINLFRDPRWGRGQETYGEDPYLTAEFGKAFVNGLQGDDPETLKLVATLKHFAVHSGPENQRHSFNVDIDEPGMREFYLFAFEACVKESKPASIMGAYNRVNGEPACASTTLLQKILRDEWGFDGYVVSDCGAILDIYAHHKVCETAPEAASLAVKNGCDLNCGEVYPALLEAEALGLITEKEIDIALERVLAARFQLGIFDPPGTHHYTQIPMDVVASPAHHALALQAARESIVLLKNENHVLPLSKDIASLAVIGPNADHIQSLLGNYHGTPSDQITPLEGIRKKVSPTTRVEYAAGCNFTAATPSLSVVPGAYLLTADKTQNGLTAKYYQGLDQTAAPALQRTDTNLDFIWKDSSPLSGQWGEKFGATWQGFLVPPRTGNYRLGMNGYSQYRLLLDNELVVENNIIHHPILKTKDLELEAGREYSISIQYRNEGLDPQIQLLWALPGQDHEKAAVQAASNAEAVIMVMGLTPYLEGEEMEVQIEGFAGGDRTNIDLPASQLGLLKQVNQLGKPVILVLLNGSALAINWANDHVPAILEAWYPGQAGGQAIADVLFGDYNPSGKLPVTFYKSVDDLPPFHDYQLAGHTYRYFDGEPLYAFGHGLSYTSFEINNLQCDKPELVIGDEININVDITNTGRDHGEEVVQLYIQRPRTSPVIPGIELKGFKRLQLAPGEKKTLTFSLHSYQLGSYEKESLFSVSPGIFRVLVGSASNKLVLDKEFRLNGKKTNIDQGKVFFTQVKVSA